MILYNSERHLAANGDLTAKCYWNLPPLNVRGGFAPALDWPSPLSRSSIRCWSVKRFSSRALFTSSSCSFRVCPPTVMWSRFGKVATNPFSATSRSICPWKALSLFVTSKGTRVSSQSFPHVSKQVYFRSHSESGSDDTPFKTNVRNTLYWARRLLRSNILRSRYASVSVNKFSLWVICAEPFLPGFSILND